MDRIPLLPDRPRIQEGGSNDPSDLLWDQDDVMQGAVIVTPQVVDFTLDNLGMKDASWYQK